MVTLDSALHITAAVVVGNSAESGAAFAVRKLGAVRCSAHELCLQVVGRVIEITGRSQMESSSQLIPRLIARNTRISQNGNHGQRTVAGGAAMVKDSIVYLQNCSISSNSADQGHKSLLPCTGTYATVFPILILGAGMLDSNTSAAV